MFPQLALAGAPYLLTDLSGSAVENSMSASYEVTPPTVNLSAFDDWKQYAAVSASDVNEKADAELLPNYSLTNGSSVVRGAGIGVTYSWTDGTPTVSGSYATYAYLTGTGLGMEWVIPATTAEGTLKFYTRTYNGTNRFTVT